MKAHYEVNDGGYYNIASGSSSATIAGTGNTAVHDRSSLSEDTVYVPKLEIVEHGEGIILSSHRGTRYKIIVEDGGDGSLITKKI